MRAKNSRKRGKSKTVKVSAVAETMAPYDREMVVDDFGPLTGAARERWLRARRKRGRPRRGKGAKVISVTVEKELLARSDTLARDLGLSRAGLIERGLKAVLAVEGKL
jgi:hypothetical protein